MVDWFGLDIVDDMSSNPHDEGANVDDPRHQHTAQGQRQWQEAKAHAQTLEGKLRFSTSLCDCFLVAGDIYD